MGTQNSVERLELYRRSTYVRATPAYLALDLVKLDMLTTHRLLSAFLLCALCGGAFLSRRYSSQSATPNKIMTVQPEQEEASRHLSVAIKAVSSSPPTIAAIRPDCTEQWGLAAVPHHKFRIQCSRERRDSRPWDEGQPSAASSTGGFDRVEARCIS